VENNRIHLMGHYNDRIDSIRNALYRLLEFNEEDFSEKKDLAKREVMFAIGDLRNDVENL